MNRFNLNILANYFGRGWSSLLSIAFVPLYLRLMGIEAYGLIGLFTTLQVIANRLDLGLSATMNREMARYSTRTDYAHEVRDLVRTLEVSYWTIAILIGSIVVMLSPLLAYNWVQGDKLTPSTVQQAIALMGLVVAFQWPVTFYAAGLMGLQRQVLLNGINVTIATLRGVGAVLILAFVSATVQAFFAWQLFVSALQTLVTAFCLWTSLPRCERSPRFRKQLLGSVWRFAVSISATSLLILALGQLDKVLLSKMLSLKSFGYYMLAITVSSALAIPVVPISEAVFPRLCQLVAQHAEHELRQLFHRGCQLVAFVLFPISSLVVLFSVHILSLWTGDQAIAAEVQPLVSILALCVALDYAVLGALDPLQMAYGWLKPSFYSRLVALLVLGPILTYMAVNYGALGAAITWLVVYSGYALITPHLVYYHLLKSEKWVWYVNDVAVPLAVSFATAGLWHSIIPAPTATIAMLFYLAGALLTTFLMVALSMDTPRRLSKSIVAQIKHAQSRLTVFGHVMPRADHQAVGAVASVSVSRDTEDS